MVRDGQGLAIVATPKTSRTELESGRVVEIGLLGVSPDPDQIAYERQNVLKATWMGVERTVGLIGQILSYLGEIISGARTTEGTRRASANRAAFRRDGTRGLGQSGLLHGCALHQPGPD